MQDKALRRISELREQCQLEQKAKRHLEEELRSDMEEKEHIIEALQTKVTLLKTGSGGDKTGSEAATTSEENLIDLEKDEDGSNGNNGTSPAASSSDSKKVAGLEGSSK